MKNIFTAILFLSVAFGFGQNTSAPKGNVKLIKKNSEESKDMKFQNQQIEVPAEDVNVDYSQIFNSVQVQAAPNGGISEFRRFIASSFRLPEVNEKTIGTVVAKFVVWDDGSIRNIQIIKETPIGLGLGEEAIRVLSSSEKWKAGLFNGRSVKQYYTLPISIQITPKEKIQKPTEETKVKSDANLIKENEEEARVKKYGYQPEESSEDSSIDYTQIFTSVHEQAVPPGGINVYRKHVASSFKLPEVSQTTIATVVAKFVVWDDGSIRDIVIIKESPAGLGLGKEAIRILSSSEKWKPGVYKGRTVKQYYTLPIMIQIEEEKTKK